MIIQLLSKQRRCFLLIKFSTSFNCLLKKGKILQNWIITLSLIYKLISSTEQDLRILLFWIIFSLHLFLIIIFLSLIEKDLKCIPFKIEYCGLSCTCGQITLLILCMIYFTLQRHSHSLELTLCQLFNTHFVIWQQFSNQILALFLLQIGWWSFLTYSMKKIWKRWIKITLKKMWVHQIKLWSILLGRWTNLWRRTPFRADSIGRKALKQACDHEKWNNMHTPSLVSSSFACTKSVNFFTKKRRPWTFQSNSTEIPLYSCTFWMNKSSKRNMSIVKVLNSKRKDIRRLKGSYSWFKNQRSIWNIWWWLWIKKINENRSNSSRRSNKSREINIHVWRWAKDKRREQIKAWKIVIFFLILLKLSDYSVNDIDKSVKWTL